MSVTQHEHGDLQPGQPCPLCKRKVPKPAEDERPRTRSVVSVQEPEGEHGVLKDLMEQVARKYEAAGLLQPGEQTWKYGVLHFALYNVLTLDLVPVTEGA